MAPPATEPVAKPAAPRLVVHNLADDFLTFWDATRTLPAAERVSRFKREVASKFPAFYGVARFDGRVSDALRDRQIDAVLQGFGPSRDAFAAKLARFQGELERTVATFVAAFPDFESDVPVYLLHSLGEMDGGMREIDGRSYLIFGADGMVDYHPWADETAFFHHELFHVHHTRHFAGCPELWCTLWTEGLAVYVAARLNPQASPAELLLDVPAGLVARIDAQQALAWAQLQARLASREADVLEDFFQGGGDDARPGLPSRRGYYLGYLVAAEIGRERSVGSLAQLNVEQARPLVEAAVARLAARGGETAAPR